MRLSGAFVFECPGVVSCPVGFEFPCGVYSRFAFSSDLVGILRQWPSQDDEVQHDCCDHLIYTARGEVALIDWQV